MSSRERLVSTHTGCPALCPCGEPSARSATRRSRIRASFAPHRSISTGASAFRRRSSDRKCVGFRLADGRPFARPAGCRSGVRTLSLVRQRDLRRRTRLQTPTRPAALSRRFCRLGGDESCCDGRPSPCQARFVDCQCPGAVGGLVGGPLDAPISGVVDGLGRRSGQRPGLVRAAIRASAPPQSGSIGRPDSSRSMSSGA